MRRRDVLAGLLLAATVGRAWAQQPGKVYRIALVSQSNWGDWQIYSVPPIWAFLEQLSKLGYNQGQNLTIEQYSGDERAEHYPELIGAVVRTTPDVIVSGSSRMVLDFKAATATIPIVGLTGDPVAAGIVSNLAHPGGNVTGVSADPGTVTAKRIGLLREVIPKASRIGFLASRQAWELYATVMRDACKKAGISLVGRPLESPYDEAEYSRVFSITAQERAEGLVVSEQTENIGNGRLIVELAERTHLPAIYAYRYHVELGGLMAYAYDLVELMRHAADEIGQILSGTKPGDIPYYRVAKFNFFINLKTAKSLGLTIPLSLLVQTDETIE